MMAGFQIETLPALHDAGALADHLRMIHGFTRIQTKRGEGIEHPPVSGFRDARVARASFVGSQVSTESRPTAIVEPDRFGGCVPSC